MRRSLLVLLLVIIGVGPLRADDDADLLKSALALQKIVQKTIQQTEPAIVCILVSRSERYQEIGQGPDGLHPGKLGTFNPLLLHNHAGLSEKDRTLYEKLLDFTHPDYVPRAFGSGVVIDAGGLILTNYHVVQDATKIFVRLPGGKSSYADIHAADPRCDLAVLKLLNPDARPLKTIAFGDADKLERGQFVLTMSNPFAVGFRDGQPSASWGILSNIRRRAVPLVSEGLNVKPFHFYSTLLQTDARLHLGCSGGALLNLQGEMVGLITSMAAIQGGETPSGFAVPVTGNLRRIIDVLKRGEEVDYGFLGIAPDKNPSQGKNGIRLRNVGDGSPAAVDGKLGIGDVILAINNQPLHDSDDIFVLIATHLAGTKIQLLVQRSAEKRIAHVTLAKLNVPGKSIASSTGNRPYVRGLRVDYASLVVQQQTPWPETPRGVLISDVQPNTAADRADLKAGTVITHVNQVPVTTPAAFYQALPAFGPVDLTLYNSRDKIQLK